MQRNLRLIVTKYRVLWRPLSKRSAADEVRVYIFKRPTLPTMWRTETSLETASLFAYNIYLFIVTGEAEEEDTDLGGQKE